MLYVDKITSQIIDKRHSQLYLSFYFTSLSLLLREIRDKITKGSRKLYLQNYGKKGIIFNNFRCRNDRNVKLSVNERFYQVVLAKCKIWASYCTGVARKVEWFFSFAFLVNYIIIKWKTSTFNEQTVKVNYHPICFSCH